MPTRDRDWEAVHQQSEHQIVLLQDNDMPSLVLSIKSVHPSTGDPVTPPVNQGEVFLELSHGDTGDIIADRVLTYQVRSDRLDLSVDGRKVVRRGK